MKKGPYIIFYLLIGYFVQTSHAQVASYPFTGNTNDISGNNHNGVGNGAVLSVDRNGNPASAYSFNGLNQSISIAYHSDFNILPSGEFTISLWVNPASFNSSARALFIKCNNGSTPMNSQWDYGIYLFTNNEIMIGYHNTHVCFSTTQLQAGQWYCVAATYNNGDWKLYINGMLESQSLNSGLYITQSMSGIGIGKKGESVFDHFSGKLDDIKFYNVALTAAQVSSACASTTGNIPIIALQSSDTLFCEQQCINFTDLSANNPTSWQWHFNGATPDTSSVQNPSNICYNTYGSFDVTLIACNASGCDTLILPGFIKAYQSHIPTIQLSNDTTICANDTLQLNAITTANSVTWSPQNYLSCYNCLNPVCIPSTDISYMVTTDNVACPDTAVINITVSVPNLNAGDDTTIYIGDDITLNATGAISYQWNFNATLSDTAISNPVATPTATTNYIVTGYDELGCKAMDTVKVSLQSLCNLIFIPNTFSPNTDGINDVFKPILNTNLEFVEMSIYDRWGKNVFTTNNLSTGWNGKIKNTDAEFGVYVYLVKYYCDKVEKYTKGNLTLLR